MLWDVNYVSEQNRKMELQVAWWERREHWTGVQKDFDSISYFEAHLCAPLGKSQTQLSTSAVTSAKWEVEADYF